MSNDLSGVGDGLTVGLGMTSRGRVGLDESGRKRSSLGLQEALSPSFDLNLADEITEEVSLRGEVSNSGDHFELGVELALQRLLQIVRNRLDIARVKVLSSGADSREGVDDQRLELRVAAHESWR